MSTAQPSSPVARGIAVTSLQQMRTQNLRVLLDEFWSHSGEVITAADLMEPTGLTRTTVLDMCRDLERRQWITPAQTVRTGLGRQALGFSFNHARTHVVGAVVGPRSMRAVVADLSGTILGRGNRNYTDDNGGTARGAYLGETIHDALEAAGISADGVASACVGVTAPVDAQGKFPVNNEIWDSFHLAANSFLTEQQGWHIRIENDANLAALAEQKSGTLQSTDAFITLLFGQRLRAGIVLAGKLHRGANGTAGEVDYLFGVSGINDLAGIVHRAGGVAAMGLRDGLPSRLHSDWDGAGEIVPADVALDPAQSEDPFAKKIVDEFDESFATAISAMCSFIDPTAVVLAGDIARFSQPVVDSINTHIQQILLTPPTVVASTLGNDVVIIGAVNEALNAVRERALED